MKSGTVEFAPNAGTLSHLGLSAFLAVLLLVTAGCQQQRVAPKESVPAPSGAELFREKCSQCHDLEQALKKYRSADVWRDTITRMREEHDADISGQEVENLVAYHVNRQKREAAVFNEKCQKCHPGKVFLEQNLTPDQARAIVKRMQQKAGNTIEDEDIEIIVRYHIESHQAAMEEDLRGIMRSVRGEPSYRPGEGRTDAVPPRGVILFLEKCSTCHEPDRALSVIKDPEVWAQTIKRMQHYSKGEISDREVNELVDFHVTGQQHEIETFEQTCTKCHDDERINSRSMSEEEWLATIRRMQQKAPELITDEKVTLLAAYFHRRELTMARIFYGKCQLCHYEGSSSASGITGTSGQMNNLIVLANEEFGDSLLLRDVNTLRANHVQRQTRNMRLYGNNCEACHLEGIPGRRKKKTAEEEKGKRSRAEWISFIAALQGIELNREIQATINSQIDFHISRF